MGAASSLLSLSTSAINVLYWNGSDQQGQKWRKKIAVERGVIDHFLGYQGRAQYYKQGYIMNGHGSVVVRKEEGDNKTAVKCHLIRDGAGYIVKAELTTWRPAQESEVIDTKHSWNVIKALSALHDVSEKFGPWTLFLNNCFHFRNDVVAKMVEKGPSKFKGPKDGGSVTDWNSFYEELDGTDVGECIDFVPNKKDQKVLS